MFFNKNNKMVEEIFKLAKKAANESGQMTTEDGRTIEQWFDSQGGSVNWEIFALVSGVFLNLQSKEKSFPDKEYRKIIGLVGEHFVKLGPPAEEAFYDLADFVLASHKKGVDHVSATGLWLICKAKKSEPAMNDVKIGYDIGQFLNKAVTL